MYDSIRRTCKCNLSLEVLWTFYKLGSLQVLQPLFICIYQAQDSIGRDREVVMCPIWWWLEAFWEANKTPPTEFSNLTPVALFLRTCLYHLRWARNQVSRHTYRTRVCNNDDMSNVKHGGAWKRRGKVRISWPFFRSMPSLIARRDIAQTKEICMKLVDLACSCAGKGEICPRPYVSITRIQPFNLGSYLTFDFRIQ